MQVVKQLVVCVSVSGLSLCMYAMDVNRLVSVRIPILKEQEVQVPAKDLAVQDIVETKRIPKIEIEKVETPLVAENIETSEVEVVDAVPKAFIKDATVTTDQLNKEELVFEEYDELCSQMPARQPSTVEKIASCLLFSYDVTKDFMYKRYLLIKYLITSWLAKDKKEVADEQPQT